MFAVVNLELQTDKVGQDGAAASVCSNSGVVFERFGKVWERNEEWSYINERMGMG